MARVYLGLGSNLGDREAYLGEAVHHLGERLEVRRVSPVYETDPWGYTDQDAFLNQVVEADTGLAPPELLAFVQQVELALGRERLVRWGPRTVDIDILLYDDLRLDGLELTIPHARLMERAFVLAPLADLAPDLTLPGHGLTVAAALQRVGRAGVRPI